jgi:hypothetical protein
MERRRVRIEQTEKKVRTRLSSSHFLPYARERCSQLMTDG